MDKARKYQLSLSARFANDVYKAYSSSFSVVIQKPEPPEVEDLSESVANELFADVESKVFSSIPDSLKIKAEKDDSQEQEVFTVELDPIVQNFGIAEDLLDYKLVVASSEPVELLDFIDVVQNEKIIQFGPFTEEQLTERFATVTFALTDG